MSSPYLTGTLVEEVVEMVSCSGEYIRLSRTRLSGGGGGGGRGGGQIRQGGRREEEEEEEEVNEGAQGGGGGGEGKGQLSLSSILSCFMGVWLRHSSCP